MSKFNFYFIALASLSILFSCNKSDDSITPIPVRDYGEQKIADSIAIHDYLTTHYIKQITDNPGGIDDQDIEFAEIDDTNTQEAIFDSPLLHTIQVEKHNLTYTIYYLKMRDGVGENPTRVDKVLTAYEGSYLYGETKDVTIDGVPMPNHALTSANVFETVQIPNSYFALHSTIVGFSEVFPLFKPGTIGVSDPGTPVSYLDFGAGVMFVPSGLAYFNYATATIPSYSPLMFKFKFYQMERDDYDGDGILSIDEDLNHDGIFTNDDTDGDGIQNFMDVDDDGDGYNTVVERRYTNPADPFNTVSYYPYDGGVLNLPGTPYIDERQGIPDCNGDYTTPTRLRKHLDPSCH